MIRILNLGKLARLAMQQLRDEQLLLLVCLLAQ